MHVASNLEAKLPELEKLSSDARRLKYALRKLKTAEAAKTLSDARKKMKNFVCDDFELKAQCWLPVKIYDQALADPQRNAVAEFKALETFIRELRGKLRAPNAVFLA